MNYGRESKRAISRGPAMALVVIVLIIAVGLYAIYGLTASGTKTQSNQTSTNKTSTSSLGNSQVVQVSIPHGAVGDTDSRGYLPEKTVVVIGSNDTVVWSNNDRAPHTVTSKDGSFRSGNLNPGDSFTWTFTTPGNYTYFCDYHLWMSGTISVADA